MMENLVIYRNVRSGLIIGWLIWHQTFSELNDGDWTDGDLDRWCWKKKVRKYFPCPDWHLIDMAKINAWILYRRHFCQNGKAPKDQKSFLQFSLELSYGIILATKVNPSSSRGWPPKRRSLEAPTTDKKPTKALPVTDICFDQVSHWLSPTTNKNWCRLSSMTCTIQCSQFKTFLCLLADCNCFVDFHTKP